MNNKFDLTEDKDIEIQSFPMAYDDEKEADEAFEALNDADFVFFVFGEFVAISGDLDKSKELAKTYAKDEFVCSFIGGERLYLNYNEDDKVWVIECEKFQYDC